MGTVSAWDDEAAPETHGGGGCAAPSMCSVLPFVRTSHRSLNFKKGPPRAPH